MTRSERLEQQLDELDFTNVDLCHLADVAPSSVHRWLSGSHEPPLMLVRLLDCMILLRKIGADATKAGGLPE